VLQLHSMLQPGPARGQSTQAMFNERKAHGENREIAISSLLVPSHEFALII